MLNIPTHISLVFGLTTLLAASLFYAAGNRSKWTVVLIAAWLALQTAVALSGFYLKTDVMPPRCALLFWPPVVLISVSSARNGDGTIWTGWTPGFDHPAFRPACSRRWFSTGSFLTGPFLIC